MPLRVVAALLIEGGSFSGTWDLAESSVTTVIGTGLELDGGNLTGFLADGTAIAVAVTTSPDAELILQNQVPVVPGSWAGSKTRFR